MHAVVVAVKINDREAATSNLRERVRPQPSRQHPSQSASAAAQRRMPRSSSPPTSNRYLSPTTASSITPREVGPPLQGPP